MAILNSELILHPDGSIYHLNLLPEDISDIIITVGDQARVHQITKYFDAIEVKKSYREFVTHTGRLGKKRITVLSTGIGTDNIDIVINELDALANIDLKERKVKEKHTPLNIIRIGTSGSLQADIPVDTFLKSKYTIGIDSLLHFYDYITEPDVLPILKDFEAHSSEFDLRPYMFSSSSNLFDRIGKDWLQGLTLTCPGFYAPQGRILRYRLKHKDYLSHLQGWKYNQIRVTNFEMETSAIYGLSRLLGHEAISLNAIIANRATGTFAADPKVTVERLIQETLKEISEHL